MRRAHPLFESQGASDVVQNLLCPISLSSSRDSSKAAAKLKILGRSQVQPSSLFAPQVRFPDSHALFDHLFTKVPPSRQSDVHSASPSALCSSAKAGGKHGGWESRMKRRRKSRGRGRMGVERYSCCCCCSHLIGGYKGSMVEWWWGAPGSTRLRPYLRVAGAEGKGGEGEEREDEGNVGKGG